MLIKEGASIHNGFVDLLDGIPDTIRPNDLYENGHSSTSDITMEPIAIIGMGCRLPGGVNSASKLWDLLRDGKTGQCKVPSDRFNVDAFYHPKGLERPGSMHTSGGYFLKEDPREFDPGFFGISPLEATQMDPQQRKLLEVVFEAFESAGVSLQDVSGANIGCYVGNFTYDFQVMQSRDPEYLHRYSATGMGATILGNRISHTFNLKGPSLVLDTACSSSLYGLHVACSALALRECDSAIVAGTNLIQSPDQHLSIMKAGVLSGTSTCHTFSDDADGYGRADGVGCLFIKRLADAVRDNDPIRAIIRGTAVNSNGRTPGITLPSSEEQEAVIRKAYGRAGLSPEYTTYIECHGTGTPVGDPIEVEGISRVFGKSLEVRDDNSRLLIGSVKTNLGHSEAASGIAGIMKTVLAMEHKTIPATVGIRRLNPKIKTKEWHIDIVNQLTPWPLTGSVRRAGVNSFGYGGANAHAILESADIYLTSSKPLQGAAMSQSTYLIPVSANSEASLERRVEDLHDYVSKQPVDIADFAYTLSQRRSHLPHRGFFVVQRDNLPEQLKMDNLQTLPSPVSGANNDKRESIFVFTGQGAQWPEMGKTLLEEYPIFANAISEMDAVLQGLPDHAPQWTLRETILEPAKTSKIHDAARAQPICTAIQVALVKLLGSWDIVPSAVVGHSSGEIAAAFAAGRLSSADAIIIAYYRGYAVSQLTTDGAMMAVGLNHKAALEEIRAASLQDRVCVACVNSPESLTLSGDGDAIEALSDILNARHLFARKLNTGGKAYHSHHMKMIGDLYESLLNKTLDVSNSNQSLNSVRWISSVTKEEYHDVPKAEYWRANLENPVLFSDAVEKVLSIIDEKQLIEVGPHSALEMPLKQIKTKLDDHSPYFSALIRFKNDVESIIRMVGRLYLNSYQINWSKVNFQTEEHGKRPQVLHDLPPYPWSYDKILWHECRASSEYRHRKFLRHELLGSQVSGGNGLEISWRNILKIGDIPWIMSHKLNDTIVFPGAGYMGMALEAMRQVAFQETGTDFSKDIIYNLRNVQILEALIIPPDGKTEIELFTTLRPTPITLASVSKRWWDFSIVSYENGLSVTRATGMVCFYPTTEKIKMKSKVNTDNLEQTQPRVWYKIMSRVGLNFGSDFQSIKSFGVPITKNKSVCLAKAPLIQNYKDELNQYVVHPITLDAMLQASIVASCSGEGRDLRAKVPVSIGELILQEPNGGLEPGLSCSIHSESHVIGFGSVNCLAELVTVDGLAVAQLNDIKCVPYSGGNQINQSGADRHPMLRVLWKPDILRMPLMPTEPFTAALLQFVAGSGEIDNQFEDKKLMYACLDLISHKTPGLRILELGNEDYTFTNNAFDVVTGNAAFSRLDTYMCGFFTGDGILSEFEATVPRSPENITSQETSVVVSPEDNFDVVLLPAKDTAQLYLNKWASEIKQCLSPDGGFIIALSDTDALETVPVGFHAIKSTEGGANQPLLVYSNWSSTTQKIPPSLSPIVVHRGTNVLIQAVIDELSLHTGQEIVTVPFEEVSDKTVPVGSVVFAFLELEDPLLARSSDDQMDKVKVITNNATKLVWVTSGDLIRGSRPEFGVAFGLSRAVMTEQPSLKWFCFDIDDTTLETNATAKNIISIISSGSSSHDLDYEFIQKDGVIYVSRFVPDDQLNRNFRQSHGNEIIDHVLENVMPVQLDIKEAGNFSSIYFKQITTPPAIGPLDVQVSLKTVGLNAKDYYVLGGKTETQDGTCTLDSCGVIERVGSEVSDLKVGDRVVIMAPGFFRTSEIFPHWACQKLQDNEPFEIMCTLPLVYSTALYGLRDRASLQSGETVLIHSAAGGLGIAAIQIARLLGAGKIFATVSTEEKKQFLIDSFGLKRANIFNSRDTSFVAGIMDATMGQGVDIVFNSLVGDLLHESWKCCSSFGRFIEVGKRDLMDCGRLEMEHFLKNATFTAFDLTHLYYHPSQAHNKKWAQLLKDVLQNYRDGQIKSIDPVKVFDVSEAENAFRYFSSQNRMGKTVISLENPMTSKVPVQLEKYHTLFNTEKTYIMIGCLGGLGKSLSKWMLARGARNFVFLGRSGIDKPSAQQFISDLEIQGAKCRIIRGDVNKKEDVEAAMAAAESKIGGIIQAAMGLHESLWTSMSNDDWHTSIDPKLTGTWNLHQACQGRDEELDFFLMLSSISGSVGTATEANYCAANYFLDVFSRYRRTLGQPATAIGLGMISEVGYIHENPDIEALLLRKGIQAISEDEMLQIIDIALSSSRTDMQIPGVPDVNAQAHILTGLEPFGLKELRKQGWEGIYPTLNDPRATLINRVLETDSSTSLKAHSSRLQSDVLQAIQEGSSPSDVILKHIAKRFSNLVLLPLEKVDINKSLSSYGMDSMIAAEFRSWFYQAFQVDVPFLDLMSRTSTIKTLSQTVFTEIESEL